ncbi:MAG TPA: DUF502 domain-containing protein [Burkholderiaceae bacterium]|jgi:uncharacterized membrane protein|nr:DUF502 domain-containing protein [Burkholderiaceae bacterium]
MRKYLVTGLLIWVPLVITLWVLNLIVTTMDQSLQLLPVQWHPHALLGHDIPGLGVLLTVLVVLLTGLLARNIIGERLVLVWESLLGRIPIVRTIYSSVKQVSDTILSPNGQAFRQALLVQYPRAGVWTIAFQTGTPAGEVRRVVGVEMVSVYVPTTPNPTSGFFLMVPRAETIELDMSVDEALKYVVSMGVVAPADRSAAPTLATHRE